MLGSRSGIKSKREKLAEKKSEKESRLAQQPPSKEEGLYSRFERKKVSAEDEKEEEKGERRGFNRLNVSRLKKAEYAPPIIDVEPEMEVVEEVGAEPMTHPDARTLLSYRIEGNSATKYVSDLYLH